MKPTVVKPTVVKPTVLIVDDSLTVRMDLAEAFESAGLTLTLCTTLAEARAALSNHPFSLIVLDVVLPDGDGLQFLQEIRVASATPKIPIILLSSEAEVRDRIKGLNTGANEYVGKPYDRSYVVARALELLRKDEPQQGSAATKVLIIDDSATFRAELTSLLESSGYRVVSAATGEEGLRAAVAARPAAIIVDSVLPGIDGGTVIRRIRADAMLRSTPCILLTASEERGAEPAALEAGADAYVRKEEDAEVILARVCAVLRSAGTPVPVAVSSSLLAPKKILAVDDSAVYLSALSQQLRQEGYEVVAAHSGADALQLLEVESVDCILLDVIMPGLSGQETCRRIKSSKAWRDIPLILHTIQDEQHVMIEGINSGADDYIPKNGNFELLLARIRAQLRRRQFEDENRALREQVIEKELQALAAKSARELAEVRAAFIQELERKNAELEAFSYSVSHDLRAPLRSIDGFSRILAEDHGADLNPQALQYLHRVRQAANRMGELIDDLLLLSRVGQAQLRRDAIDLSPIAGSVFEQLQQKESGRSIGLRVEAELLAEADSHLMRVVFENLLGNAWKFTSKTENACIEIGIERSGEEEVFFVRDNGAGFDSSCAQELFQPFRRMHSDSDFPGTGIGLATVRRIVERHGGRIWAHSEVDRGATFYFTLRSAARNAGDTPAPPSGGGER